jgi:Zn-dependent peptidase ImmA (M78 family)/DNA-binding XRE family transcriptional regulator
MDTVERITEINRDRVRWCCRERGITVEQLADEVGISKKTITQFFEIEEGLTFIQLRKIADYFGRGVLFFLDEGPVDPARVHSVQYRTLANQKPGLSFEVKKLVERVERQRDVFLSLREASQAEDRIKFSPPVLSKQPEAAAAQARKWLGLARESSFDEYRERVEAKGVLVIRSNGYVGQWQIAKDSPVLGFNLYDADCPVIFVRKSRWDTQQTFTLMHELGHILLHRSSSVDDDADMHAPHGQEREANAFAGHLLVPEASLLAIDDRQRPNDVRALDTWLKPHRTAWGVSTEMLLRRLVDVGRLEEHTYVEYRAFFKNLVLPEEDRGNRMYRYREPKHIFGEPFVRAVLGALSARRISATKACSYLDGLKLQDLHQLERHVASL